MRGTVGARTQRLWLVAALAVAPAVSGCDGPGAGGVGGGGVACSVNPNQPFCYPDGGAGRADATAGPDALGAMDGGAELPDVAGRDASGAPDQGPAPDAAVGDAASCSFGESRCALDGVTVEACVNGAWVPIDVCAPPATCVDGACQGGCVPSCAGVECGPDGCGGACGACAEGAACVDGQCVVEPPGGACTGAEDLALLEDGTFAHDFNCLGQCVEVADPACASPCFQDTYGFTPACAGCSSAMVACGVQACLADCATDPQSAPCLVCVETHCAADFEVCAGVAYDVIGSQPPPP